MLLKHWGENTVKKSVYYIMLENKKVLEFEAIQTGSKYGLRPLIILNKKLLPPSILEEGSDIEKLINLTDWFESRTISVSRDYIKSVLTSIGISRYNAFELLLVSRALSLNDHFWIKEIQDDTQWEDVNIYDNGFSNSLSIVTFCGSPKSLGGNLITPELTTQGVLAKCWRNEDGLTFMYKRGTSSHVNAGREPFIETIACNIANILNLNHVYQELTHSESYSCSKSMNFTDKFLSHIPAAEYMKKYWVSSEWNLDKLLSIVGEQYREPLNDMLLLDYIINNTDRHWNNFGFLVEADSLHILKMSPLFDHGFSLLHGFMDSDYPVDYSDTSRIIGPVKDVEAYVLNNIEIDRGKILRILKNLNSVLDINLVNKINHKNTIITDLHLKSMKELITYRCNKLLNK